MNIDKSVIIKDQNYDKKYIIDSLEKLNLKIYKN